MKGQLLEKIKSLYLWFFCFEKEECNKQEEFRKHFLARFDPHKLISGGQKALLTLEAEKKSFLEKVGPAGSAFASRHFDPVIASIKSLVSSLQKKLLLDSFPPSAVGSVELLALTNDEKRPLCKVRESARRSARQALMDDIAFLTLYPRELVNHLGEKEQISILKKIEKELRPVMERMEKLLEKKPLSDDFETLFLWRAALDIERQMLHDAALKNIDSHVSFHKLKFSVVGENASWQGAKITSLNFAQLTEVFSYLFELVKSSENLRSDERVLSFFEKTKNHLQTLLGGVEKYPEEERMRILQTVQLIDDFTSF